MFMSRIQSLTRTPTLALRQRKSHLLRSFELSPHILHTSLVERFLKCGKANCHCHSGGPKHGPFFYLTRFFPKGQMQSMLLKSPDQISKARLTVAAYTNVLPVSDATSQINNELRLR